MIEWSRCPGVDHRMYLPRYSLSIALEIDGEETTDSSTGQQGPPISQLFGSAILDGRSRWVLYLALEERYEAWKFVICSVLWFKRGYRSEEDGVYE